MALARAFVRFAAVGALATAIHAAVFAALGLQLASNDTNPGSQVVFRKKGG